MRSAWVNEEVQIKMRTQSSYNGGAVERFVADISWTPFALVLIMDQ